MTKREMPPKPNNVENTSYELWRYTNERVDDLYKVIVGGFGAVVVSILSVGLGVIFTM